MIDGIQRNANHFEAGQTLGPSEAVAERSMLSMIPRRASSRVATLTTCCLLDAAGYVPAKRACPPSFLPKSICRARPAASDPVALTTSKPPSLNLNVKFYDILSTARLHVDYSSAPRLPKLPPAPRRHHNSVCSSECITTFSGRPLSFSRLTPTLPLHFWNTLQKSFSIPFSIWSGSTTTYSTKRLPNSVLW